MKTLRDHKSMLTTDLKKSIKAGKENYKKYGSSYDRALGKKK